MRWWLLLFFLLLAPGMAAANNVNVTIEELGKITSYLNTYWVVNVNGTGTVSNPSSFDLFDVRLQFDILTLDLIDLGGDGRFEGTSLYFDRIPAGGSATFSYKIVGITAQPPTLSGRGVLYTGFAKRTPRIFTDVFGELQKAPVEDPSITGRNARLISVTLNNPGEFQFTIESMRVLKTPTLDPTDILDQWQIVNDTSPLLLDPNGFFVHDFLDYNASEGQVYWLQSDVFISRVNLIDMSNVTRYTEENLTVPIEELNFTNVSSNKTFDTIRSTYLLRKQLSNSVAIPGEPLDITLLLYNFGPQLESFQLTDSLPPGFNADQDLSWTGEVSGRGSAVFTYRAVLNDTLSAGFDVWPAAKAIIGGETIYSVEIPYLRQFQPDDKIYVQKRVTYEDEDRVLISLSVQNLGKNPVERATLKEFLGDDDLFSEISEIPLSKGVWDVPILQTGDIWEVTYVTEPSQSVSALPMLFGVPSQNVLRTIILENVVSEAWEFVRTRWIEMAGIIAVILVPVLLFFGRKVRT